MNQSWQLLSGDERQEHEWISLERQEHERQTQEGQEHVAEIHWFTKGTKAQSLGSWPQGLDNLTTLSAYLLTLICESLQDNLDDSDNIY